VPPRPIPEHQPLSDSFTGLIIQVGDRVALAAASPPPPAAVIAAGRFTVRYGLRFLGKPQDYIIPGLLVLDYGDMLTGEEAWEFLWHRSNLHPRAEVVGWRSSGQEDMVFLRQLDFALPPQVVIYAHPDDRLPLACPEALIAADSAGQPERLLQYLASYPTVETWQMEP